MVERLQMPYEPTRRVDFGGNFSVSNCPEVPTRTVYKHKPLADQGRFGSRQVVAPEVAELTRIPFYKNE